ncbi:MAG TPA: hypothetical protein VEJ86_12135 [Candidatus Binataceae bacterium]|nr:hypothetical protein [Candidatus Binataceae bacterium]
MAAVEEVTLRGGLLTGARRARTSGDRHEVEAELDTDGLVRRLRVRYVRGVFTRSAAYEAVDELFEGRVGAGGAKQLVSAKLGRYREVDGDLVIFRALTITHIIARGQIRWTGRVATIDPSSLVAVSRKQSCRRLDPQTWSYESGMGDSERIEIDGQGRILRRRDDRGTEAVLVG